MKVSNRKKNERKQFARKNKKCIECGESIADGGHFVPAIAYWICTDRYLGAEHDIKLRKLMDANPAFRKLPPPVFDAPHKPLEKIPKLPTLSYAPKLELT